MHVYHRSIWNPGHGVLTPANTPPHLREGMIIPTDCCRPIFVQVTFCVFIIYDTDSGLWHAHTLGLKCRRTAACLLVSGRDAAGGGFDGIHVSS